jgi:hypothetical protein
MNSDEDPPALAPSSVPPMPIERFREAETERPGPPIDVDEKFAAILASFARVIDEQLKQRSTLRDIQTGLSDVRKNTIVIKAEIEVMRDDIDYIRRTTSGDHVALVALHGRVQEIHEAVVADHELVTVAGESISALQRTEEERQAQSGGRR